ncbi:hypothetical protein CHELA1G11_20179 [Hyphomicrobiales bacterium]|nr:hypothetical protein CHELA1G11_20179 [Hyphomicrobiales bacterium]CAH1689002.1 hypothetical protein CHELA1G2_20495 [Hyphomicrobiales bacterium]
MARGDAAGIGRSASCLPIAASARTSPKVSINASLGMLIGYAHLFSGEWWVAIFPSLTLVLLLLVHQHFGEWLRNLHDPKLRRGMYRGRKWLLSRGGRFPVIIRL